MNDLQLVVISGISGSGKSTALRTFEDMGFFTVDRLPIPLLPDFMALAGSKSDRYVRSAVLPDITSRQVCLELLDHIGNLTQSRVLRIFLDAGTPTLIKRYSETRRPHPSFSPESDKTLSDAITRERDLLNPYKESADLIIDTSDLNVHELRRQLQQYASQMLESAKKITVNISSFGYKYGVPGDCDLMIDVRFLPNPHFVEELKDQNGLDEPVKEYVMKKKETKTFLRKFSSLLDFLIPRYIYEGKAYLNIAVGCTGGKHRSVVIATELADRVDSELAFVSVQHRDVGR